MSASPSEPGYIPDIQTRVTEHITAERQDVNGPLFIVLSVGSAFELVDSISPNDEELIKEVLSSDRILIPINKALNKILVSEIRKVLVNRKKGDNVESNGKSIPTAEHVAKISSPDENVPNEEGNTVSIQNFKYDPVVVNLHDQFPLIPIDTIQKSFTESGNNEDIVLSSLFKIYSMMMSDGSGRVRRVHPALEEGAKVTEINPRKPKSTVLLSSSTVSKISCQLVNEECCDDASYVGVLNKSCSKHMEFASYYSQKASEAYASKNFGSAGFYSAQKTAHLNEASKAKSSASELRITQMYDHFCKNGVFDMHGFNRNEAYNSFDLIFHPDKHGKPPHGRNSFTIVTGWGLHSKKKKSPLKTVVRSLLMQSKIRYVENNPGSFLITL